ncbi:ribonuclease HII [Corynebacterium sp. TAE3-ERU30]|uniref:ribonuclease HII n=1 Tax=Corynebacterium sp. TAE3-ERU30 TaxID=2849496 RepID=UPI001C47A0EC|nr:ribonuclease HII [Corynebacterium sp. TAE3-ERU30]
MRKKKYLRTYEAELTAAGLGPVAGVDEAGRGACAGPITIAACVLPDRPLRPLAEVTDSKKLTPAARAQLAPLIKQHALAWSVIHISAADIDARGLQHANISGMRRAIYALDIAPGFVLIDGYRVPGLARPSLRVISGDAAARCIAAASVLAKHERDTLMLELDERYPGYGLAGHKGYGTKLHMDAVRLKGPSPVHRYSYRNIQEACSTWKETR